MIAFGRETDTQDALGETTHEANLPNLNRLQFEALLQDFVGEIEQIPPMYSAIKKNGQPLYKLAREGKVIEREARKVRIHTIKLLSFDVSSALIEVSCSKGTYIRTLCQDIGRAAGSAAHMSFLLRTKSGNFCINDAVTLEEIAELNPSEYFINPLDYLENMPKVVVTDAVRTSVLHGNKFSISDLKIDVLKNEKYLIIDKERNLLALGSLKGNCIQPEKVFG